MIRATIILLLFWNMTAYGQDYQMDENLLLINDCGGFFSDSGGSTDDYGNNENFQTTICKNPLVGTHIRLTFSQIDLGPGDKLCFFDGLDTSADSILCAESFYNGFPFIVQATAANNTGCITVTFTSNSIEVGNGWEANIDCIPACQLIDAQIEQTTPPSIPVDRGWIDICQGERVFFNGSGSFPQNDLVYAHSDATSTFEWDFGDGNFAVGNNVSHVYEKSGGYRAILNIIDQFGCTNANFALQKVRVAPKPLFKVADIPDAICLGDTLTLASGLGDDNETSPIEICNQDGAFLFSGIRSDSISLPDGNGASYQTSIRFTDFKSGQVLNDISDLQSICVNMEHSWLHDMEIRITCPSGNTVLLQNQAVINKEVYLGIPEDNDGITPTAGIGSEYCWSPTSNNGTMTEFANDNDNSSPNETYNLPAGEFNSFESLEALLGCPLNGDWVITVTDLWEQDNGTIFSWSLDINPNLYPDLETFQTSIETFQWQNHADIINYARDKITIQPSSAGEANFVLEAMDDFGCSHDTAIQFMVLPNNHPECLNCDKNLFQKDSLTICQGESINLESTIDPFVLGVQTFQTFPDQSFSNTTNPPENAFESPLQISNIPTTEIKLDGSNLISVCLDLTSEFNSDLAITLISPNGVHLNLSSENGGRNDGYLSTCFTANATRSITEPSAGPFTGDYLPEESFDNLAGTDINGVWTLKLSDDAGAASTDVNVLKSWSMTFLAPGGATFTWSPSDNLSCTTCTNPTASPSSTSFYVLEKDFEGCIVKDTLQIKVLGVDEIVMNISDFSLENGQLLINWDPIIGADSYEISTNSVDWMPTNGELYHIFENLQQNTPFNVQIRGVYDEFSCTTKFTSRAVRYKFCDLNTTIGSNDLVTSCHQVEDASVEINATGGDGNYTYTLNNETSQTSNTFSNLGTGSYTVLVEDVQTCADTITFSITEPPKIAISFETEDLDCFGDNDGMATVLPSGGVGNFRVLSWGHTSNQSLSIGNLSSGEYYVTVADGQNCEAVDTLEIFEPAALQALASEKPVTCFGMADGEATVKVTGGAPPYAFAWDNGQTGSAAVGLDIGDYNVIVEDGNNCRTQQTISVSQPDELDVDFLEEPLSCPGETDAALLADVAGGIAPYNYKWSTGQTNQFTFGLKEALYFLTVTDNNGCEKEVQKAITAPNALAISISSSSPSCNSESDGSATVFFLGGTAPFTFKWDDPLAQTTQTANNLSAETYQVTVTDFNGCEAIQSILIQPSNAITVSFDASPATCHNRSDGGVTANATGGTGNLSFLWENGTTNATNDNLLPGRYAVTIQDANGCQQLDTALVEGPMPLQVDSINQIAPLCNNGNDGQLEAFISGGSQPYTVNWDNNQSAANPFIGVTAGDHVLSVSDLNGCTILPVSISLAERPPITFQLSKSDNNCFDEKEGAARVVVTGGGTQPYSYLWNDSEAQTDGTALNLPAGNYTVLITDGTGCTAEGDIEVTQPNSPISTSFLQTDTACFKQNTNRVTLTTEGGTGSNYIYNWSSGSTQNIANDLMAGRHFVSITDENNCQIVDTLTIVEHDSITYSILEAKPSCADVSDGRLALTPITGGTGNGIANNYQINWSTAPAINQNIIDNLAGSTNYEVTVTDQSGCAQTLSRFLESPEAISVILAKTDISCFGLQDGQINVQAINNVSNITSTSWSANALNTTANNAIDLTAGIYTYTLMDDNGCSVTVTDTIHEPNPIAITNFDLTPNLCIGDANGQINILATGGTGELSYNWSNGSMTPQLTGIPSGIYDIELKDENGCVFSESFELKVPDALAGTATPMDVTCFGDSDGGLSIAPIGGKAPFTYSLDGNTFNGLNNIVGLSAGAYTPFIKDANNCIWKSDELTIGQPLPFEVEIRSEVTTVEQGDSAVLIARFQNNNGNIQYSWSANAPNTFNCAEGLCDEIVITPAGETRYELYAVDANGCEANASINIQVAKTKKIFVPTGFSPNGDGENDYLLIHGKEGLVIQSFTIFDRWGETIYLSNDLTINNPKNAWDGTFKGQALNTGVYVWLLEVVFPDDSVEIYKGSTTLIR